MECDAFCTGFGILLVLAVNSTAVVDHSVRRSYNDNRIRSYRLSASVQVAEHGRGMKGEGAKKYVKCVKRMRCKKPMNV